MLISRSSVKYALLLLITLGVLGSPPVMLAQVLGPSQSTLSGLGEANPLQLLRQRLSQGADGSIALEGALDPSAYIIGPGDVFSISTGGALPNQSTASVSADGSLVIPDVGALDVAGKTLAVVEAEARAALQRQYQNVPVEITLAQPRRFYVHISGAVPRPGRYLAVPAARVSDVLEDAYAVKTAELQYLQAIAELPPGAERPPNPIPSASSERPELNAAYQPSLRNIMLTRRDGSRHAIDLFLYFATGDTKHNPYLLDGDVIAVAPYHIENEAITVSGEVAYPGKYAFRPGDTLQDLLLLASGSVSFGDVQDVHIARRGPDGTVETLLVNVSALRSGDASAVALRPGDRLTCVARVNDTARVYGRVKYPGTYPIQAGKTTLRELVDLAGGPMPDANVQAAYLQRDLPGYFKGDGRASDLDFFSRAYLGQELNQNRVVIDVEASLEPGGEEFYVQNGDAIVFPRDDETVFVTGNVPRPGYVPYVPGKDARYYIEQAGGKGPLTTSIYVFETGSGSVQRSENALVRSGDTIFVDRETVAETPEIAQLALTDVTSKRQSRILTTQTIIAGISAIAGIITAYAAITR